MGEISRQGRHWLRDFVSDGLEDTGKQRPDKAEGRALFDTIDAAVAAVASGQQYKEPVVAVATTNVVLASGADNGSTIDGVVLATGDRVALVGQTAPAENGVYVVPTSGTPARASDMDAEEELVSASFLVQGGDDYAITRWVQTTPAPISVGSTGLTFVQIGAAGDVAEEFATLQADVTALAERDALLVNAGNTYPLTKVFPRGGGVSAANAEFNNALLDAAVAGAEPGKLYKLARLYNDGANLDRWIVQEFDQATYASAPAPVTIQAFSDPSPAIDRTAAVTTVVLKPPSRPGLEIRVTLAPAALLSSITDSFDPGDAGYSWVIDPAVYSYTSARLVRATEAGKRADGYGVKPLLGYVRDGDVLDVAAPFTSTLYQIIEFGRLGVNLLPDFGSLWSVTASSPERALAGARSTISTRSTDFLGPWQIAALSDGDGSDPQATGGNHSRDNDGITATAANISMTMVADGAVMADGAQGVAEVIRITFVNQLSGYNTAAAGRRVLEEHVTVTLRAASRGLVASVDYAAIPLEPVEVRNYQGPQLFLDNYSGAVNFLGGPAQDWIVGAPNKDSGPKSAIVNIPAIAIVRTGPGSSFTAVTWIDTEYGIGDRSMHLRDDIAAAFTNGAGKAYHRLVAAFGSASPIPLDETDVLRWRGGYFFGPTLASATVGSGDVQLAFPIQAGLKAGLMAAVTEGSHKITTDLAVELFGDEGGAARQITASGWIVGASGYEVPRFLSQ